MRTNPVLQLNRANAYLQGGQPGEAATILNRQAPSTIKTIKTAGICSLRQPSWATAIRSWRHAPKGLPRGASGSGHFDAQQRQFTGQTGSLQQARYDARIDRCARYSSASSRTKRCKKEENMTDAVKFTITLAAQEPRHLSLLKSNGVEPGGGAVSETPPDAQTIRQLLYMAWAVHELMRQKEDLYKSLNPTTRVH